MLKVWSRKNSSNVQKVMWAIGELGLAYERIDLGLEFGGNDTPAYLAMNPTGLVPTLIDGDFILWESNSIVRYLANRYGQGTLEPADPKTRALANQWMDWQMSTFLPAFWDVFHGLVRPPRPKNAITPPSPKPKPRLSRWQKSSMPNWRTMPMSGAMPSLWAISRWASAFTASGNAFPIGRHCHTWNDAMRRSRNARHIMSTSAAFP